MSQPHFNARDTFAVFLMNLAYLWLELKVDRVTMCTYDVNMRLNDASVVKRSKKQALSFHMTREYIKNKLKIKPDQ